MSRLRSVQPPPPQYKCPHCRCFTGYVKCEVCGRDITVKPEPKEEKN